MASALSISSSKEEEQTNKFCLSQSETESIFEVKSYRKIKKKTTAKKSKELKRKVNRDVEDTKRKRKDTQQCNPDKSALFHRSLPLEDKIVLLKVEVKDSNEVIAKELKVSVTDEVITKKVNVLKSSFETNDKETEMKKYFILALSSLEGSKNKDMTQEKEIDTSMSSLSFSIPLMN
ncbi:hypothetical protein DKX38_016894 [Salix brachista]|uniref:Uncharacterized protein n=1 Tax=Salix brachista TaxID=2182728 RepID=A0A5N5KUI8_9ROSI|nr:hypothetical protein DKX38_016894 [Salix brachista]